MKKLCMILAVMLVIGILGYTAVQQRGERGGRYLGCVRIQDGTLEYATATGYSNHYFGNQPLMPGIDAFGYNYQARMFVGSYANIYLCRANFPPYEGDDDAYLAVNPTAANHWAWPERNTTVIMKWSDIWLSNKDCDGDGVLDRGLPCATSYATNSACEGAWVTNHMVGAYEQDGEECHWTYFVKIVKAPADAYKEGGFWYTDTTKETEIGQVVWGAFARVLQISNDPCYGEHGVLYKTEVSPGFGKY